MEHDFLKVIVCDYQTKQGWLIFPSKNMHVPHFFMDQKPRKVSMIPKFNLWIMVPNLANWYYF